MAGAPCDRDLPGLGYDGLVAKTGVETGVPSVGLAPRCFDLIPSMPPALAPPSEPGVTAAGSEDLPRYRVSAGAVLPRGSSSLAALLRLADEPRAHGGGRASRMADGLNSGLAFEG